MITIQEALEIHKILIEQFSGGSGLRDLSLLESALQRPFQTFDGSELYSTPIQKSAVILESIVKNHPFVDGNKRVAIAATELFLQCNGYRLSADNDALFDLTMACAASQLGPEEIRIWLEQHSEREKI